MRLRRVELNNFRQFYGTQAIEFSADSQRNVTLIHAENGFGKTTLLNSILWALFEEVTKKFEDPEKLVSFAALSENAPSASVQISFDFQDAPYVVKREYIHSTRKSRLTAFAIENGVHKALNAPITFINSVVPREMARYFFFDGEAAEAFSAQTNHRAVGQAIRSILGCSLAETAITDLRELSKEYEKEIGDAANDEAIQQLQAKILEAEDRLDTMRTKLTQVENDRDSRSEQLVKVIEDLRQLEDARAIQLGRDAKVTELKGIESELKSAKQDQLKWLGARSIYVVSVSLAQKTLNFVNDASLRGKIPSPYNEKFVKSLLEDELCICKRPLPPLSEFYASVADLLRNASNAETHNKIVRAQARVNMLQKEAIDAPEQLRTIQTRISTAATKRTKVEQEIGELGKKIENLPFSEGPERERARISLEREVRKFTEEAGGIRVLIGQIELEISDLQKEQERATRHNKRAQKVLRRRQMVDECRTQLENTLATYETDARTAIRRQVNSILAEVAHRDYECDLGDDFSLRLQLRSGHGVPKSGGENQLLSLVFMGALMQFAASRISDKSVILRPGTVAPLVLDAPLGQLDVDYQEATSRHVPNLGEQVILLLSSSQCGPRVLEALEPRIGAEYVLISENPGPRGARRDSRLILASKEMSCSEFNRPRYMTRIERIR